MTFLASNLAEIGMIDTGIVALVGYVVVFAGLIVLMAVVVLIGKFFVARDKKKKAEALQPVPAPVAEPAAPQPVAPGSAGKLMLHDVEPKTAAMLMAIVADKMGKPINELRFISIKEIK